MEDLEISESSRLLPDTKNDSQHIPAQLKFFGKRLTSIQCWACWETTTSTNNPLIRVCQGCKDPELQYIHQNCINSYISSLPQPRRPRSPRQHPLAGQQNIADFMRESEEAVVEVFYDCTRCRDPYTVEERLISPLFVIWEDSWLRSIIILLLMACLTMAGTCYAIVSQSWDDDVILGEFFGISITLLGLSLLLTVLGILCGAGLFATIWFSSTGRKRLHVVGIPLL